VHVDAPVGVPGATALGFLIARRLRSAGKTARILDDRYLQLAAQRSVRCRTAVSASAEPARRRGLPAGAVAGAAVITGLALAGLLSQHRNGTPATELVEGRVAVRIPADWPVRRVTEGPGSARLEAVSPSDPGAVLHITQSPVPTDDLAATAKELQLAAQTQPPGVFIDFNAADRQAGRPAVTYREVRPGHDIRWTVVVTGRVRIGIGCQSAPGRSDDVAGACAQAISSAREIS
jgi:type VII secretion-associated protein (TIGR03931 family)